MKRRDLLRAGLAGAALLHARLGAASLHGQPAVALVADPADPVAAGAPARRALEDLRSSLADAGTSVRTLERVEEAGPDDICVIAAGAAAPAAAAALADLGLRAPDAPESLALVEARVSGRRAVLACGADARGLAYALLELADRVRAGEQPAQALAIPAPIVQQPANAVRSVMRQFTSETLDKPWFHDRDGWTRYLTMLATHRFNRLHLAFGFGYDSLQHVADSYFLFAYPFLVGVPGYDVRVTDLPDAERDRNLETLRFISDETAARGLDFELGIWMHGYQLTDSPGARYVVEGLTPETHAAYCRDALTAVLRACPAISAVGLRIHGESGIAEGSYDFWATVFDGAARSGRSVELDLHAKGLDQTMIERALATGLPVNVSPKYAAEHLGLPYHQAAIRELEMPVTRPGRLGADDAQRRRARLHALRLRRLPARGPALHRPAARLLRHAAHSGVGRSRLRRGRGAFVPVLRDDGRRPDGAAHLPGPARHRHRTARRLRRPGARAALGLGEVRRVVPRLGPCDVRPRRPTRTCSTGRWATTRARWPWSRRSPAPAASSPS